MLVVAGSAPMLGAAALTSLAAMRSGAGLVTAAVPESLNLALQKKVSNAVMTMPLAQDKTGAFSLKAFAQIKKGWEKFDALSIGPGIGRSPGTCQMVRQIIKHCPRPMVIDADALFALAGHTDILLKAKGDRVLTPHTGEMARLTGLSTLAIESARTKTAGDFSRRFRCVLLLKGPRTVVASPLGKVYINRTGHVGLATAGSGDVLTGMIAALLGQGNKAFDSACWGAYLHGKAGGRAAPSRAPRGLIASDIIDHIPSVLKNFMVFRG